MAIRNSHHQSLQMLARGISFLRQSVTPCEWSKADSSSPERWNQSTRFFRDYIWEEVIGRLPPPSLPANPRTRLIYDEPKFRGYEVVLDVWPDVSASGILLVPKDLRPNERRPVVVCQHGLEGRASDVAGPQAEGRYYHQFAVRLAEQGFVIYAPQNPYIGEDRFRLIQRKGHPIKLALFSSVLGQHQVASVFTGSRLEARPRFAFRPCWMDTPFLSVPAISTSGSGKLPASIRTTATC